MQGYAMRLRISGRDLEFPVLPAKLEIVSPGKNERATVLKLGEVLLLRQKGLRSVAWSSHFPAHSAPYVTGAAIPPIEAVRAVQAAREAEKAVQLLLVGNDLDFSEWMGIEDFDYEERGGEVGDIYYKIKLTEWKSTAPTRITLPQTAEPDSPAVIQEPERPGAPPPVRTYAVAAGNSLWGIAQKMYGDGSRYPEIYAANQALIDGQNRKTGASKFTIYQGQVFAIP